MNSHGGTRGGHAKAGSMKFSRMCWNTEVLTVPLTETKDFWQSPSPDLSFGLPKEEVQFVTPVNASPLL